MKNRLYTYTLLLLCGILILTACKKEITPIEENSPALQGTSTQNQTIHNDEVQSDEVDDKPIIEHNENYTFPQMGNTPEDFIPKGTAYQIDHIVKGDLNGDELEDIAIVLTDYTEQYLSRPLIVILQNTDGTYRLDKVSKVIMQSKYIDNQYSFRYGEKIDIRKGFLYVFIGFTGEFYYKYVKDELILHDYTFKWIGTGGTVAYNYNIIDGVIELFYEDTDGEKTDESTYKNVPPRLLRFEDTIINDLHETVNDEYVYDME